MRRFALLALIPALALTACGAATGSPGPTGSPSPTGPRTIPVSATDQLRFEPEAVTVTKGETVRFEVTNAGQIVHEFFVGDEQAQGAHEDQMRGMGGMQHDEPDGISLDPGETKVLELSFDVAGQLLAGCHEPGHYDGGMVAIIDVQP